MDAPATGASEPEPMDTQQQAQEPQRAPSQQPEAAPQQQLALVPVDVPATDVPTANPVVQSHEQQQQQQQQQQRQIVVTPMAPTPMLALPPAIDPSSDLMSTLSRDGVFIEAVKQQDVDAAAAAAIRILKLNVAKLAARLQAGAGQQHGLSETQQQHALLQQQRSTDAEPLLPLPAPRYNGGEPSHQGAHVADAAAGTGSRVKTGDWVVIRSSSRMTDPELIGQIAVVNKVEAGAGWVEVHVPKLGLSMRLQQRYLSHLPDPPEALRQVRSTSTGIDDPVPSSRKRQHSDAWPPLPARIPPLQGRGLVKMREVLRQIRKEMLSLEENIPWDGVEKHWKVRRPTWRKGLKSIHTSDSHDASTSYDRHDAGLAPGSDGLPVALMAGAMADLHESLRTDKSRGLFARGGPWEVRLCELADGGNNYVALRQVWEEMQEGVRVWLGLQPAAAHSTLPVTPAAGVHGRSPGHELGSAPGTSAGYRGTGRGGSGAGDSLGLSAAATEKLAYLAVRRALAALEAAALKGEAYLTQVPLEKILGPSRDHLALVRSLVEQEKQFVSAKLAAAPQEPPQQQPGGQVDPLPGERLRLAVPVVAEQQALQQQQQQQHGAQPGVQQSVQHGLDAPTAPVADTAAAAAAAAGAAPASPPGAAAVSAVDVRPNVDAATAGVAATPEPVVADVAGAAPTQPDSSCQEAAPTTMAVDTPAELASTTPSMTQPPATPAKAGAGVEAAPAVAVAVAVVGPGDAAQGPATVGHEAAAAAAGAASAGPEPEAMAQAAELSAAATEEGAALPSAATADVQRAAAAGTTPATATAEPSSVPVPPAAAASPGPSEVSLASIACRRVLDQLMSPQLRAELQVLQHGLYSEPDSDGDRGPEATDLEDSD